MLPALSGLILGAIIGGLVARKRGGNVADILQYGASYGIAFALVGLIAAILFFRFAA